MTGGTQTYTFNLNRLVVCCNAYDEKKAWCITLVISWILLLKSRLEQVTASHPDQLNYSPCSGMPGNAWLRSFQGESNTLHPENGNF